jgi:hypothetical protein
MHILTSVHDRQSCRTQQGKAVKKKELTHWEIARLSRSARPISIKELEPEKIRVKYSDRRRSGKTKKDREGGARARAYERKQFPIRRTSSGSLPADGSSLKLMGG